MNKKIVGILICTLLIGTVVLPVMGTMNEVKDESNASTFIKNQEIYKENALSLHELEVDWERLYGGANEEVFRNVKQTTDGGYIMVGAWNSESHCLMKVDENGEEEWSATALPNPDFWPRSYYVIETSDGGFITTGSHEDEVYLGHDRYIWKVDANGNTEFLKTYEDPLYAWHMCIRETDDGGYIICGEVDVDENNPSDFDVLLMKTDATGNVEWQQIFRYGEFGELAYAVRQTLDGGYILSGRVETSISESDFLIIKTDENGNKEWDRTHGGNRWEQTQSKDILFTEDGGYLFLAATRSYGAGNLDLWLIKTDSNGNMVWNKTFGGTKLDMSGGLDFTDDGGIIITGTKDADNFFTPKSEGLVIKTDANGNVEWQKEFGYDKADQLQSVCSTSDGGYIVAGNSDSTSTSGAGMYDGWLIKIKAFENDRPQKPTKPSGPARGDPDTEYTFSTSSTDSDGDQIYYMWDWGDGNFSDWLETPEALYTWTTEDNFEIKVMVQDEHGGESEWSDPLSFSTPRRKVINSLTFFIERLIERFPLLELLFN
jgi:hypothetical protein